MVATFLALSTAGCATTRIEPTRQYVDLDSIRGFGQIPPVAVFPVYTHQGVHRRSISGFPVIVDYDDFTKSLCQRLAKTLNVKGAPIGGQDAPRRIRLQVSRVTVEQAHGVSCALDFNLALGNAPFRGIQTRASRTMYPDACGAALSEAVVAVLNDPDTRDYLASGAGQ